MIGSANSLEIELESTAGGRRRLSSLRGRVAVLFWEDRERHRANAALKEELAALARDPALAGQLAIVPVGDLKAYDFTPARGVVRGAIATIARAIGVEILLDWQGALAAPPFSLTPGVPNVLVLDREGRPILRASGELAPASQRALLAQVQGALAAKGAREAA